MEALDIEALIRICLYVKDDCFNAIAIATGDGLVIELVKGDTKVKYMNS